MARRSESIIFILFLINILECLCSRLYIGGNDASRRYFAVSLMGHLAQEAPSLIYNQATKALDTLWSALNDDNVSIAHSVFLLLILAT
jgi:hypothetical protein